MKIAIEASWAQGQPTGIGYYVLGLLQGLKEVDHTHEYYLLHWSKGWSGPDLGNAFIPVSYYFGKASLALRYRLGKTLKKLDVDLYHATAGTGVPVRPPCPTLCTVHDLIRFQDPFYGAGWNGWLFKKQFATSIERSNAFVCNSQCTADDLLDFFPRVSKRPVVVTPLAAEPMVTAMDSIRSALLCLGGVEERKGQLFLLDAYRELLKRRPDAPRLVFAGPNRGDGSELKRRIGTYGLGNRVSFLGYVDTEHKRKLYSEAILFLMPSRREGFGIPMLEAMQCGTPVIAADIPIFREIGGRACRLVNRFDVKLWAETIDTLLEDEEQRRNLTAQGAINAKKYSWKRTAETTLKVYEELCRRND